MTTDDFKFLKFQNEVYNTCGWCRKTFTGFIEPIFCASNSLLCPHMFHWRCHGSVTHCHICKTSEPLQLHAIDHTNYTEFLKVSGKLWGFKMFQYYTAYFSVPHNRIGCPDKWYDYLVGPVELYSLEFIRTALIQFTQNSMSEAEPLTMNNIRFYFKMWLDRKKVEFVMFSKSRETIRLQNILIALLRAVSDKQDFTKDRDAVYRSLMGIACAYVQSPEDIIYSLVTDTRLRDMINPHTE